MPTVLGIDLGTSNSCVVCGTSAADLDVLSSPVGGAVTPSYVTVGPDAVACGEVAKQKQAAHPDRTFYEFKRTIGRVWSEKRLWADVMHVPFHLTNPGDPDKPPRYSASLGGKLTQLTAFDLYVHLLRHMLADAPKPVDAVVATVPAHFHSNQRDATAAAVRRVVGEAAAVTVLDEPTAAAVAYLSKLGDDGPPDGSLMVVDVGGGTTDVTLLRATKRGGIRVLNKDGTPLIGGAKMTDAVHAAVKAHCRKHKVPTGGKDHAVLLRDRAEHAKRVLSTAESTEIAVGDGHPPLVLTRDRFEQLINNDVMGVCELAARTKDDDLRHIVLVGGATRIPLLRERLQDTFPDAAVSTRLNPETAVAKGAALHALASAKQRHAAAAAVALRTEVLGATIGVRVGEDTMHPVIPRRTTIPMRETRRFRPQSHRQRQMRVVLAQGEDRRVSRNAVLGQFTLAGAREIELTIEVGLGGGVVVTAFDAQTKRLLHNERAKMW